MRIRNMAEANEALQPFVPLVSQLTGKDTTLKRIQPLMALIDNPQDRLKIIHLAGTSGKTSTAYYVAELIRQAGKRVGLTVSPHIDSVTERVQINGRPISDELFCQELGEFLEIVKQLPAQPSYFELLYAFAFFVFERQKVEYAVVETGMGGLHDATNVADQADKVCVITDIGFDHMHILGHTLPEIAAQKIGIVHDGNQTFMYRQAPEVMEVVERWAAQHDAPLTVITEADERQAIGEMAEIPDFQQRNWLLAYRVYRYLMKRDGLPTLKPYQLQSTQQTIVPARMEIVRIADKQIIMDGAHNAQKMATFVDSFRRRFPAAKPAIMLAVKQSKETQDIVPVIAELASKVIITTFKTSQDLPAVSIDPRQLAQEFRVIGFNEVEVAPDQQQAFEQLLNLPDAVVIITGSFYLLSQLRSSAQRLG